MVRCSQCHHENGTGATECARCGSSFEPATTSTAFGFRSPLHSEPEPSAEAPEFRPARTSYGSHVLDEDGAFDLGALPNGDAPSSVETFHGLKLEQTVLLPGQAAPASAFTADEADRGAGATAFGLNPVLEAPDSPGGTAQQVGTKTMIGISNAFDGGESTLAGLSALSGDERIPARQILGDLGDTWVDNMFDQVSATPTSPGSENTAPPRDTPAPVTASSPPAPSPPAASSPLTAPETLPDLVRPACPSSAPGFGIVRKKRTKRAESTQQKRAVSSAGSYENRRAAPERPNVETGRIRPVSDPIADSTPVARITAPIRDGSEATADARTAPIDVSMGIPRPPPPEPEKPNPADLAFGETLILDVGDLDTSGGAATQILPHGRPRDRLSPLSVKAAPKTDSLKPLPVTSAGLPRPAIETPGVGTAGGADNAGEPITDVNVTAGFSPDVMASQQLVGAETQIGTPGPIEALPMEETTAFSPSMDLDHVQTRGITSPSGNRELQLEADAVQGFLEGDGRNRGQAASSPFISPAPPAIEPAHAPPAPTRGALANDDLFAVAESAGLVQQSDGGRSGVGPRPAARPRHLDDASRAGADTWRQIVLVAVVVALLAALSFLGFLLYQELTGGSAASAAETTVEAAAEGSE